MRYESGISGILRQRFSRTGTLQNVNDDDFRGIIEEVHIFAFAKSFYLNATTTSNMTSSESIMFTIAHIQDPTVQCASARGLTFTKPLSASWFPLAEKLLAFHYLDYHNAFTLAGNFSTRLTKDASKTGADDYVEVAALTA